MMSPSPLLEEAVATRGDESERLARIPRAHSTRRVPLEHMRFMRSDLSPRAGDLVVARVERVGQHSRLHLPDGRRRDLFLGDEVIVAYADRYAPSQYEAFVPSDLARCHLVAGGGIAARVASGNSKLGRSPTEIIPLGLIAASADGPALNLDRYTLPQPPDAPRHVPTLAVVGSSMDSGKTTALAELTHAARQLGLRVGYAKLTGTAAGGDPWLLADAGADPVLDFTDAGYASTYRVAAADLEAVADFLTRHLYASGVDIALLEVADGLFQPETARLMASARFRARIDGVLYAAVDALGAAHGASLLAEQGYRLLGLVGMVSTAPLLGREAQSATQLPVYGRKELGDASVAARLLAAIDDPARALSPTPRRMSEAARPSGSPPPLPRGRILHRRTASQTPLDYLAYVPNGARSDAPLLVAVHGYTRDAQEQAESFAPLCESAGCVLAAPLFDEATFPDYQRLGRPGRGERADHAVDEMVQDLRFAAGLLLGNVSLFGYSGGGQFTHRYLMAYPKRVCRAIVAAPGWYTFPDRERAYPYGSRVGHRLEGVRMDADAFLRVPVLVIVGDQDDETRAENLRREPRLDLQQGQSRLERGARWVHAMNDAAQRLGFAPSVRFALLAGAGHSFADCMESGLGELVMREIDAAAEIPADEKPLRNRREIHGLDVALES